MYLYYWPSFSKPYYHELEDAFQQFKFALRKKNDEYYMAREFETKAEMNPPNGRMVCFVNSNYFKLIPMLFICRTYKPTIVMRSNTYNLFIFIMYFFTFLTVTTRLM